jgi:hypothetical protein
MTRWDRDDMLLVHEILSLLDKKYPEVLYDDILDELDVSDDRFSELLSKLDRLTRLSKKVAL